MLVKDKTAFSTSVMIFWWQRSCGAWNPILVKGVTDGKTIFR